MNNIIVNKIMPVAMLCVSMNALASNVDIGSREYKILLNTSSFTGDQSSRENKVDEYWDALKELIEDNSIERNTSGSLSLNKSRTVSFYDVKGSCDLSHAGYSFRERIEEGDREVTLKFRSADQFIAGGKDLTGTKSGAKTKFEEDISAPFVSIYSFSTKQEIEDDKNLNKMDDPIGLYSGLEDEDFDEDLPIEKVGNLTVNEYVYEDATVDLGSLDAEFSLTLWYDESQSTTKPIVAEISFKYEDDNEDYSNKVLTRAKQLFTDMQEDSAVTSFNSEDSLSKTATVYQYDSSFCN
ncbi:hypothetical protein EU508_01065 [Pseudoalteromonas fuliginea]|uniref:DUF1849 family protein n=1 Tax=Pseudoalteromonas fuliginea TaxID=1872678 RepID=A0AB73BLC7_9GAMM|nr:hypothetical protein [Pseudoalteromonas fuliginea]KAA1164743.1 hypothetical protein EU508_01065 [Pseudoalteromonas fuliginea]